MEISSTFGFPAWNSLLRPCYKCNVAKVNLYRFEALGVGEWPGLRINTPQDYETACARAEVVTFIVLADRDALIPLLRYVRRKTKIGGRELTTPFTLVDGTELQQGDRLEPCPQLLDVAAFDTLTTFPTRVVWWRASMVSLTHRRNPIFADHIGITLILLVVHVLHCLHLGVMNRIAMTLLWRLISLNAYDADGDELQQFVTNVSHLKDDLFGWYSRMARGGRMGVGRGEELTQLSDLSPNMFGARDKPAFKVKAMECWGVFQFLPELIMVILRNSGVKCVSGSKS